MANKAHELTPICRYLQFKFRAPDVQRINLLGNLARSTSCLCTLRGLFRIFPSHIFPFPNSKSIAMPTSTHFSCFHPHALPAAPRNGTFISCSFTACPISTTLSSALSVPPGRYSLSFEVPLDVNTTLEPPESLPQQVSVLGGPLLFVG